MTSDDGHAVELGAEPQPLQCRTCRGLVRDDGVHQGLGPSAHRRHVVDVGQHGGDPRAERVALHEGRPHGLAGDEGLPTVVLREHRRVVPRAPIPVRWPENLGHHGDPCLAEQARVASEAADHLRELAAARSFDRLDQTASALVRKLETGWEVYNSRDLSRRGWLRPVGVSARGPCGVRKRVHAACRYSWSRPPSRSRRRTSPC